MKAPNDFSRRAPSESTQAFEQDRLESLSFRNRDGSIVLILLNGGATVATFNLSRNGKYASYHLEPASTFRWPSPAKAR
jgi:hypothetical protein